MIARVWTADATPANAAAYAEHFTAEVLPSLEAVPGYARAELLTRDRGGTVEIMVVTWWHSFAAIRGFAGGDPGAAVVADHAVALLVRFDRRVRHFERVAP